MTGLAPEVENGWYFDSKDCMYSADVLMPNWSLWPSILRLFIRLTQPTNLEANLISGSTVDRGEKKNTKRMMPVMLRDGKFMVDGAMKL